jgi:hypothetical protein
MIPQSRVFWSGYLLGVFWSGYLLGVFWSDSACHRIVHERLISPIRESKQILKRVCVLFVWDTRSGAGLPETIGSERPLPFFGCCLLQSSMAEKSTEQLEYECASLLQEVYLR